MTRARGNSSSSVTATSARGAAAGPRETEPSAAEYWLPWHGQEMTPPSTRETSQPWWVQMLVNALNSPALGWVRTTCSADTTSPPPTGISAVAASGVPPLLVSDGAALGGCAGDPAGVLGLAWGEAVSVPAPGSSLPPQAARTPATPTAPAPSSTTRRWRSGLRASDGVVSGWAIASPGLGGRGVTFMNESSLRTVHPGHLVVGRTRLRAGGRV